MSLAELRREAEAIRRTLTPVFLDIMEGWLKFTADNGEERYRGCFAPNYEAAPFEGITGEALRHHWRQLEQQGYQVTAIIYDGPNIGEIYRTPERRI